MSRTRLKLFSFSFLAVAVSGCPGPAQSTSPEAATGDDTGSTGDTSAGSSSDGGESGADSSGTTGVEPEPVVECAALDSLSLAELLEGPPPGSILSDGQPSDVIDIEFAEVDGGLAVVAVVDDETFLLVELDESGEAPSGQVQWHVGSTVYIGEAEVTLADGSDAVTVESAELSLVGGEGQVTVSACFVVGAGSSAFTLDGSTATLNGVLGSLTFAQVEAIVQQHPEVDSLVLSDVPGSINDEVNVQTGRMVRDAGWSTFVAADGVIASGGVDLFCAGATRSIEPGAQLGVHSWSDGTMDGIDYPADDPAHDMQLAYFTEMLGDPLGPDFYWFTLQAAPADDIHWMTTEEIEQYQLLTR